MKRNKKEENVEKEVAKQLSVTQYCIAYTCPEEKEEGNILKRIKVMKK